MTDQIPIQFVEIFQTQSSSDVEHSDDRSDNCQGVSGHSLRVVPAPGHQLRVVLEHLLFPAPASPVQIPVYKSFASNAQRDEGAGGAPRIPSQASAKVKVNVNGAVKQLQVLI